MSYWVSVVEDWLFFVLIRFSKAINILLTWVVVPINSVYCAAVMYFSLCVRRMRYSVSLVDPTAICRKRAKSAGLSLPLPSAIFVGIDAQALRIWLVNPYISSWGNWDVDSYTFNVNSCDFRHTSKFLKSCNMCSLWVVGYQLLVKNSNHNLLSQEEIVSS